VNGAVTLIGSDNAEAVACNCAARFYGDDRNAHQLCCAVFVTLTPDAPGVEDTEKRDDHRGWQIEYAPPPIPIRDFDYTATHPDFDGEGDTRQVWSATIRGVVAEIDNWYEDQDAALIADRFANDAAAKAHYDTWSYRDGWVPWVERGNSEMQDQARSDVAAISTGDIA